MTEHIHLHHRSVVTVDGLDAETFLHGVLTQSTLGMNIGDRRFGALLTPQGKVVADLFIERSAEGFRLDAPADAVDAVVRRLTLFKLRARVMIAARPELEVAACPEPGDSLRRTVIKAGEGDRSTEALARWDAARIAACAPEQGRDFAAEEVFPADVNMDLRGGVEFAKGCFVGQEVVSRMKRRGIVRKRTLAALGCGAAVTAGAPVLAGSAEIGVISSAAEGAALARIRIDRLVAAEAAGEPVTCASQQMKFERPPWLAEASASLSRG